MKNIEKYFNEIKAEMDNWDSNDCIVRKIRDKTHLLSCDGECSDCRLKNLEWLNAEYQEPIKLTHAEKVILENINKNYKWIARDNVYKTLGIHRNEPRRSNEYWVSGDHCYFGMYEHLFQFIKWEDEPYEIAWLLENCEVIEE